MNTRYFIEIKNKQGRYEGRIHQGDRTKSQLLDDLKVGPDDSLSIKEKVIHFRELKQALLNFDKQWLKEFFDERGQYEVGMYLYKQLFGVQKPSELMQGDGEVEVRIITDDDHIAYLPWVLLAHNGRFLVMTRWSVALSGHSEVGDHELPPLPKVLIAAPEPQGVSKTQAQEHCKDVEDLLNSTDTSYKQGDRLEIVRNWEDFKEKLRTFQPHVLYYYGHGESDGYSTKLVFAKRKDNTPLRIPAADLTTTLEYLPEVEPIIAYINCCSGHGGGLFGTAHQLGTLIPAVVTNLTIAYISAARQQGLAFWENTLVKAMPPHVAVSRIYSRPVDMDLSVNDVRWMTPVLYCHYDRWTAHVPKPPSRLDRDPHWRLKLDRVAQFGQVFLQTFQMFMEQKPRLLCYLWYGQKDQGIELFHQRLKVELEEKLKDVIVYEVKPDWPPAIEEPDLSFTDMVLQAFEIKHLEHLAGRIRTFTKSVSGQKTLVYICHKPVSSSKRFHPKYIKLYLEWLNLKLTPLLPSECHALVGISYELSKNVEPSKFNDYLINNKNTKLNELELPHMVFQLLDELDKVERKDISDFIKTHSLQLPDNEKYTLINEILNKSKGVYEKVLDELINLESRAWQLKKEKVQAKENNQEKDEAEDFFD